MPHSDDISLVVDMDIDLEDSNDSTEHAVDNSYDPVEDAIDEALLQQLTANALMPQITNLIGLPSRIFSARKRPVVGEISQGNDASSRNLIRTM